MYEDASTLSLFLYSVVQSSYMECAASRDKHDTHNNFPNMIYSAFNDWRLYIDIW